MTGTDLVRILLVEDNEDDAILVVNRLKRDGVAATFDRVETAEAFAAVLRDDPPDVVISDHNMPLFSADAALALLHESNVDVPFILVSGEVGEETASALMKAGAHDFVLKDRLARLAPAIQRELREAAERVERRRIAADLAASEERFRLLAEHAVDVIFSYRVRPDPGLEYVSPAITAITGRAPTELVADPDLLLSFVDPGDRDAFAASWSAPSAEPLVLRWCRPGHPPKWTEQRTVGLYDEHGLLVVEGILRDITTQTLAEQERKRLEQQVRQADRLESLGQLAGGVAHDFNNLLAVISGYADLLKSTLDAGDPRNEDVDGIGHAARRGAALTRQLLIFSRLEPSQPETLDLNAVVSDTEQLLRRTIGEDIEFVTLLEPELRHVTIDRTKLEQIILNLVVNARAAMPHGGRLTIGTSNVLTRDSGTLVRLFVEDTGTGMEPAVAERVFEPFFTTKGPGEGTGLGLATAYGAVKEAAGDIRLWSELGKGTTFEIDLPAAAHLAPVLAKVADEVADGGGETILVVEDEDAVREIAERILSQSGYQVLPAASPAEALDRYAARLDGIDLVLTDALMPGMSGSELIDRLREIRPGLPAVLMSGYTASTLPGGQTMPSTTPLLRKPFTAPTLLKQLRRTLDG
jgi:two-component system, cell cycle sensor histidine kinase and response regulator CckA